jgi:hypothetical protein
MFTNKSVNELRLLITKHVQKHSIKRYSKMTKPRLIHAMTNQFVLKNGELFLRPQYEQQQQQTRQNKYKSSAMNAVKKQFGTTQRNIIVSQPPMQRVSTQRDSMRPSQQQRVSTQRDSMRPSQQQRVSTQRDSMRPSQQQRVSTQRDSMRPSQQQQRVSTQRDSMQPSQQQRVSTQKRSIPPPIVFRQEKKIKKRIAPTLIAPLPHQQLQLQPQQLQMQPQQQQHRVSSKKKSNPQQPVASSQQQQQHRVSSKKKSNPQQPPPIVSGQQGKKKKQRIVPPHQGNSKGLTKRQANRLRAKELRKIQDNEDDEARAENRKLFAIVQKDNKHLNYQELLTVKAQKNIENKEKMKSFRNQEKIRGLEALRKRIRKPISVP